MNFKAKLISSYAIVIFISLGLITFFLDRNLEEDSLRDIKSSLITEASLIENQLSADKMSKADIVYLEALTRSLSPRTRCRITIVNSEGRVLADSEKSAKEAADMENHRNRPEVKAALGGGIGMDTRYSSTLKIDMLYAAIPVRDKDDVIGVLRLAMPLTSVQRILLSTRKTVLLGLCFALLLAFILGSLLAARIVNPVNRMICVSRQFSRGDFSRRIIQPSGDEIGELAVTLNKMAEDIENKIRQIAAQNQKLAAIFNNMIEGIVTVDRKGHIVSVNPAVEKIFGITKDDAEGRLFLETIRNNDISDVISMVLKNGQALSREISLVMPARRIFQVNTTPVFEDGGVSGCVAVIHDITGIRQLETMRRDFVANVSHELKTPLTSIKGFVETLLEGALDDKENNRHFLKIIQEHAGRLNALIEDLLSLSHLESGGIILEKCRFDLRQEIEEVILGSKSRLRDKDINVKDELPPKLPVNADKNRIGQVITNLIDNAIKFNKTKGFIRVYSQDMGDKIKVTIEDSGIGIPEKDMPRIFERFYRVDKARSRELGGTGLGLSIVKHIVELHGGLAGVESTEGLGSKFCFTLPK